MYFLCQNTTNSTPIKISIYYAKVKLLINPDGQKFSPAVTATSVS